MYTRGITDKVVPLIREVRESNKLVANHTLVTNDWVFGQSSLRLTLKKSEWTRLLDMLELKHILPIKVTTEKRRDVMINGLNEA